MSVQSKIREARKKKGLTQTELADILGKSLRMVQKYEADTSSKTSVTPGLDVLNQIAEALGVSIFELLENDTFVKGLKDLAILDENKDFNTYIKSKGIDPVKLNPWFSLSSRSIDDLDAGTMKSFLMLLFEEGKVRPSDYLRDFYDRDMYVPEVIEEMIRWLEVRYDFDLSDLPTWEQTREYLENLDFHLSFDSKTGKVEVLQNKAVVAVAFKSSLINAYVRIQKEVEKYSKYYALKTLEEIDERKE